MHHVVRVIGVDGMARPTGRQIAGGVPLPVLTLAADGFDLAAALAVVNRAEGCVRLDGLELLRIADQHHLCASLSGMRQHTFHLSRADHARLVDDKHIAAGEHVAALRPAVFHAGDGARGDARIAFEIFRRDAGQGSAAHLIARRLPCLARHAEYGALSRSSITDDDAKITTVRDMRQCLGLLAGQDKTALLGARKGVESVFLADLVPLLLGHQFRRTVEPLFDLDHVAGGEPILAASVLPKLDQIGRIADRPHELVELVNAIAVPVRKHRHVAPREGRLLMRDRVQRNGRIGDDPRAVIARDLPVHVRAVGYVQPFALDALRRRADLPLQFKFDPLRLKAAMVDARVDVEFGQPLVDMLGPAFAPTLHHLGAVPVPDFRAETVLVHRAHGEHDMGMGFGHPVLADVPMHIQIGNHALIDKLRLREVAGKLDALRPRHLARDCKLHLAGKLGVLPHLERLDIVPEPFAAGPLLRGAIRQQHLGIDDTTLGGKVLHAVDALVAHTRGRTVGGGCHRARPGLAADDLDVKMIDRHATIISTESRTSERRISAPSLEKSRDGPAGPAPSRQHRSNRPRAQLSSLHQQLMEDAMRKPRNFDMELKALEDKARELKTRKVQQLGELMIATVADSLTAEELAGALVALAETKDAGKREAWAKRGAAFFQGRSRRSAPAPDRDAGGVPTQLGGAQPASGATGAA